MPEFHTFRFDVDVWETESVFTHVTVVPAATLSSPGVKARFPSDSAPRGIVTDADGPAGVGAGSGAGAVGAGVGEGTGDGSVGADE